MVTMQPDPREPVLPAQPDTSLDADTSLDVERAALKRSLVATTGLAVLAVAWGWIAGSQVILLDGAYAAIGMVLTWLSLAASKMAAVPPTARYPYGREALVPLAIGLQGVALFGTLLYAAVEAVRVILDGGSEVAAGSLLAYGAVTAVVCAVLWRSMSRADADSDLLAAEARQWVASGVFSVVVVAGAALALGLRALGFVAIEPFVDSALVLLGCAMLVPQPLALVRSALRELMEGAPRTEVQSAVNEALTSVGGRHGLADPVVRMTKVGRKLYVDAVYLVETGRWSVDRQDEVRRDLTGALDGLPYEPWLSVELTTDASRLL